MRTALPLLLATAFVGGCNATPTVAVEDQVVALSPIAGRPAVAYFSLHANKLPMKLNGVSSPKVGRIELHDSSEIEGVMRMGQLQNTNFTGDGDMTFDPAGKHAMLFDVDPALKPGDTVPLVFDFDNAPDVTVQAPVQMMGAQ